MAPAIRWLANRFPDAKQRQSVAARATITALSRQLMALWASAAKKEQQQQQQQGPEAAVAAAAGEGDAEGDAAGGGGDGGVSFRDVSSGIRGSSFLAALLDERRAARSQERTSDVEVGCW
jgi:hypothetical protein